MRYNQGLKPPDLDDYGKPIQATSIQKPPDLDEYGNPATEEPSFASQVWQSLNEPLTDLPSRIGKSIGNWIDQPTSEEPWKIPFTGGATWKGLGAGLTEATGELASSLTSPINLGVAAATGGSNVALRAGLPEVARGLQLGARAASLPMIGHGVERMTAPDATLAERGQGLVEAAGGGLGAVHTPHTQGPILSKLWPEQLTPEQTVQPLLGKLRESLAKDEARRGTTPQQFGQQVQPEVFPEQKPQASRLTLKMPTSPEAVKQLQQQGYDFVGMDDKGGMLFEPKKAQEAIPDMSEIEPQYSKIATSEPQFAFMDTTTFPEGPEPFFHLPDGSTVSQRELVRRGIEVPQLPDEQLGIGKQFPGVEAQELGNLGGEEIDLNQALMEMESDMAKPVQGRRFAQQVLPEDIEPQFQKAPTEIPQIPPHMNEFQPDIRQVDEPILGGTSPRFEQQVLGDKADLFPQEMRVPGPEGNIAMGGASPRVLEVLGSSLYSRNRPTVVAKELLQNSFDEHRIAGQTSPIRVIVDHAADDPSNPGERTRTLTIRDQGRGMTPEELYTKFTDVGETGKAGIEGASGGFGFAKAAPMLSGKYAKVVSTVIENGERVQYTFKGTPKELIDQGVGVPLERKVVGEDIPTGLEVTTTFPGDESFYDATKMIQDMTELSPSITSPVKFAETYGTSDRAKEQFLIGNSKSSLESGSQTFEKQSTLPLQDTIEIPGSKIGIHYDEPIKGSQATGYKLATLNKGLFQGSDRGYYGSEPIPNVPKSIVADIIATVEEGHPDYPFTANREQLNTKVNAAISKWIDENITSGAQKKRVAQLQKDYDSISQLAPNYNNVFFLDEGKRFTPDEIKAFSESPFFQEATSVLSEINTDILAVADTLNWSRTPSQRLKKFGILFQSPDKQRGTTTLGVHIPRPDDLNDSAILVNVMEHLNRVKDLPNPIDNLATGLFTTITHEQAHIPGGGHDTDFAYRHAQLLEALARKRTNQYIDALGSAFGDLENGQLNPEIRNLLEIYNESRQRESGEADTLLSTGVNIERPTNITGGKEEGPQGINTGGAQPTTVKLRREHASPENVKRIKSGGYEWSGLDDKGNFIFSKIGKPQAQPILESEVGGARPTRAGTLGPKTDIKRPSMASELYNLPRGLLASNDLSAPLRQGIGLIHKKEFWKALPDMLRSWSTEENFRAVQDNIANRALFRKRIGPDGKELPSFAEDAGLKLTDLADFSNREEALMSTLAERFPGVRRSNRAYTAFLNKLRADTFDNLIQQGKVFGVDGQKNLPLARDIARFINIATGRGSLGQLEGAAVALNHGVFAPRLIAARLQMANPANYIFGNPFVRKEFIKSLFAIAAFGNTITQLGRLAGGEVSSDPTSSDFGKLKIGNTRLDPYGGFQQYIVAASRLMSGQVTSSTSGKEYDLNNPVGPYDPTQMDVITRFTRGKVHPVLGFAWSFLAGKKEMSGQKMNLSTMNPMENSVAQRFIPIFLQDMYELAQNDELPPPIKAMVATLSGLGMGQQTYGPKE